ncbi:MAG: hypothetical protein HY670_05740 [Chloroflexi bacterium]|nr:hypothetical protein [Chloroflexota bacterium]
MSKLVRMMLLSTAILAVVIVVAGCSSGFKPVGKGSTPTAPQATATGSVKGPTNGVTQASDAAAVTVAVKWARASGGSLTFDVVMDTHSVDLDQYDLKKLAVLRDDTGKEYSPTSWNAPSGGHHRSGTLVFPLPDSVTQGQAKYVEMVIKNIAGVPERVLKWQL